MKRDLDYFLKAFTSFWIACQRVIYAFNIPPRPDLCPKGHWVGGALHEQFDGRGFNNDVMKVVRRYTFDISVLYL